MRDRYAEITDEDFRGARATVDNRYKLVIHDQKGDAQKIELFDLKVDPAEKDDLADQLPDVANRLSNDLRLWQKPVLNSVGGGDY